MSSLERVRRALGSEVPQKFAWHSLRWVYWNCQLYRLRLHLAPRFVRRLHPRVLAARLLQQSDQQIRDSWHFGPRVRRERAALSWARRRFEHRYRAADESPLVSVIVPTWNRGALLVERTLPSVLNQSYKNFEVVIVGDHCTDDTEARLKQVRDPRVRFYNLPARGAYPEDPVARWRVAGSHAINVAYTLVRGQWIAGLDDDEVYTPDHLEVLLRFAQAHQLELAYGVLRREMAANEWLDRGQADLSTRECNNSASLYRAYLRLFKYDLKAWQVELAVDKHRNWRMYRAGVRSRFLDCVVAYAPLRPGTTLPFWQAEDRGPAESRYRSREQHSPEAG